MSQLKYLKVKDYLLELSSNPESSVSLPSVRALMKKFNVSLSTVNKALSILENDGIIQRRQGQGIVSVCKSRSVPTLEEGAHEQVLVLAYVDYPSQQIWNIIYYIRHFALKANLQVLEFKLQQSTKMQTLVDFLENCQGACGVVMDVGSVKLSMPDLKSLSSLEMPVAVIDSMFFYEQLPKNIHVFAPDPDYGARLTTSFLYQKGHRRIGYIRNEPHGDYSELYQKSLIKSLKEYGIDFSRRDIFASAIRVWDNSLTAAHEQTLKNIEQIKDLDYTALIYKSSPGAIAGMRVLQDHSLRVPDDIGIISEGEHTFFPYLTPALTTTSADYESMCRSAVDYATGILRPRQNHTLLSLSLNERESVGECTAVATK